MTIRTARSARVRSSSHPLAALWPISSSGSRERRAASCRRTASGPCRKCLNRAVYTKDTDTTKLLREIDSTAEKAVTAVSGDAAISRVLLLTVTGLVQSVRCRRLSLFEAEEDLKKACFLLTCTRRPA